MARKLDYRWNLRQAMASRGMFATTDLIGPLAQRGIRLSSSQVYRLVAERPERLSLKVLMALLDKHRANFALARYKLMEVEKTLR